MTLRGTVPSSIEMRGFVVMVCLVASSPAMADEDRPPLSATRLLGELGLGGVVGLSGAYLGAQTGDVLCGDTSEFNKDDCINYVIVGGFVGGVLAMSGGVYLASAIGDEHSSLVATLGGGVLGGLAGVALSESVDDDYVTGIGLVVLPIAGALIGANITRRHDRVDVTVVPAGSGAQLVIGGSF